MHEDCPVHVTYVAGKFIDLLQCITCKQECTHILKHFNLHILKYAVENESVPLQQHFAIRIATLNAFYV